MAPLRSSCSTSISSRRSTTPTAIWRETSSCSGRAISCGRAFAPRTGSSAMAATSSSWRSSEPVPRRLGPWPSARARPSRRSRSPLPRAARRWSCRCRSAWESRATRRTAPPERRFSPSPTSGSTRRSVPGAAPLPPPPSAAGSESCSLPVWRWPSWPWSSGSDFVNSARRRRRRRISPVRPLRRRRRDGDRGARRGGTVALARGGPAPADGSRGVARGRRSQALRSADPRARSAPLRGR